MTAHFIIYQEPRRGEIIIATGDTRRKLKLT